MLKQFVRYRYVEVIGDLLWEDNIKLLQQRVQILSHFSFGVGAIAILVSVAETRPDRVINKKHRILLIP